MDRTERGNIFVCMHYLMTNAAATENGLDAPLFFRQMLLHVRSQQSTTYSIDDRDRILYLLSYATRVIARVVSCFVFVTEERRRQSRSSLIMVLLVRSQQSTMY